MRKWSLLVLLLPVFAACSCDDRVPTAAGAVSATPDVLDFGGVHLGDAHSMQVEFRNDGRTPVTLEARELPAAFVVQPERLALDPGSKGSWTFEFRPEVLGPTGGEAVLATSGAKNASVRIELVGLGLSRDIRIADIDFGLVPVGESKTLPFAVQSESEGPLTVQLALAGSEAGSFTLERGVLELGAGELGEVALRFEPQIVGRRVAQLEVRTCADCAVQRVAVRGAGAVAELAPSPSHLDFGKVAPASSKTLVAELVNRGNLPILIGSAALVGATGTDFGVDLSALPVELAGGEKLSLDVTFAPPREASFEEQTNAIRFFGEGAGDLLVEVPMRGTPGGPHIVALPDEVDFGHQPVGLQVTREVTVRNIGEATSVRVLSVMLEGAQMLSFEANPRDSTPADVGTGVFTVDITYLAPEAGISNAVLRIVTDDDENPVLRVPLGGTARVTVPCEISVSPARLRYGLVARQGEYVRSITVTNTGPDDCMIWDVALGDGSPLFALAGEPEDTVVVPPGGSLPLSVRFTPNGTADILQENTLSFGHSTPAHPRREVDISAFPSAYEVEARPNPVDLGAWPIDYRYIKNLDVINRSRLEVNVTGAMRTAETSPEFGVDPAYGVPGRLVTDEAGVFHVNYAAAATGADEGQLEVWIAEAPEPLLVDVLGAGTDEACGVLCAAPTAFCPGPQTTNVNNVIQLVGAGSDPANDPLNCTWSVLSRPTGSSAAPDNPAQCTTPFTPDLVGDYTMQLTVRDPMGNTGTCTTVVHADPYGGLWVEMFWTPAGDIDLHVMHPNAGSPLTASAWKNQQWSCYYRNCKVTYATPLEWDTANLNDNPSLDRDDTSGTGPENIRIHQPSSSHHYSVGFKNFSNGNTPVSVTINVYCGGVQVHGQTYQNTAMQYGVYVGDVTYAASGCSFTPDGTVMNVPN